MSQIISVPTSPAEGRRAVACYRLAKRAPSGRQPSRVHRDGTVDGARGRPATLETAATRLGLPASALHWRDGGVYIGDARVPDAVYA